MPILPSHLEELYREHASSLLGYLGRTFPGLPSVEDILHDTFFQAMRCKDFVAVVTPRAWLFGIARHLGLSAMRRQRKMVALPPELAATVLEVDPRLEHMRLALARLSEPLREALELRLVDDLSYQEIAQILEIPIGTVRSRLHRAVQDMTELCLDGKQPAADRESKKGRRDDR